MNGEDLSELETNVIYPESELLIDLYIFGVTREVVLQNVSAVVTFAGQIFATLSEDLGSFHIAAGKDYRESITISTREALKLDNMNLVTGISRQSEAGVHYRRSIKDLERIKKYQNPRQSTKHSARNSSDGDNWRYSRRCPGIGKVIDCPGCGGRYRLAGEHIGFIDLSPSRPCAGTP